MWEGFVGCKEAWERIMCGGVVGVGNIDMW